MTEKALHNGLDKYMHENSCLPEHLMGHLEQLGTNLMRPLWHDSKLISYEQAVQLLDLNKSSGYPFYYDAPSKGEALERHGGQIQQNVHDVLDGKPVPMYFSVTLKNELREIIKVEEEKTRVFQSASVDHILVCSMLFEDQNQKMIDRRKDTPFAIGMVMPGPEFGDVLVSLSDECDAYDADGSRWDTSLHLRLVRIVRNIRKTFLPTEYWEAIHWIYNTTYCGYGVVLGFILWLLHQKSGWKSTAHDNSLYMWLAIRLACLVLWPELSFVQNVNLKCMNDDLIIKLSKILGGSPLKAIRDWLRPHGILLEYLIEKPRYSSDLTFLSHHLVQRHVHGVGTLTLAAGNRAKLLSSLRWLKSNSSLTLNENCVAHLIGLRICLFPWFFDFEAVEEIIDAYLLTIPVTKNINLLLRARLSVMELVKLYTRYEGSFLFSHPSNALRQVLKDIGASPDKIVYQSRVMTDTRSTIHKKKRTGTGVKITIPVNPLTKQPLAGGFQNRVIVPEHLLDQEIVSFPNPRGVKTNTYAAVTGKRQKIPFINPNLLGKAAKMRVTGGVPEVERVNALVAAQTAAMKHGEFRNVSGLTHRDIRTYQDDRKQRLTSAAIASIMSPEDAQQIRMGLAMSSEETLCLKLQNNVSCASNGSSGTVSPYASNYLTPTGQTFALARYSYLWANSYYIPNDLNQVWNYDVMFTIGFIQKANALSSNVVNPASGFIYQANYGAAEIPLSIAYLRSSNISLTAPNSAGATTNLGPAVITPHGNLCAVGSVNGSPLSWFPASFGDSINATFTGILTFNVYRLLPSGEPKLVCTMSPGATGQLNTNVLVGTIAPVVATTGFGYFAITLQMNQLTTNTQVSIRIGGNRSVIGHLPVQDCYDSIKRFTMGRVHASSIHGLNVVAEQYRSGSVLAFQMPGGYDWNEVFSSGYDAISQTRGVAVREFDRGSFCYMKPGSFEDLEMREEHVVSSTGDLMSTSVDLNANRPTLLTIVKVPNVTGMAATWMMTQHFEARSTNSWGERRIPRLMSNAWSTLFEAIGDAPFLFENPSHWETIKAWIKKAVPTVIQQLPGIIEKYGPMAMEAAALL